MAASPRTAFPVAALPALRDPPDRTVTFITVTIALLLIALVASVLPARWATTVSPTFTLRAPGNYRPLRKMFFGIFTWTPIVPSTSWVIATSPAMLVS
jgi:hypothetical protein